MLKNILTCLLLAFSIQWQAELGATAPYDEVVSLGQRCQVSWQMETNGIRKYAYPFDWFVTPFESLVSFIANKGAGFLEMQNIAVIGPYPGDPSRLEVVDLIYGIGSYHDFLSTPFLGNYSQIKSKYDRRIARFFDLLQSNRKVLFIRQGLSRAQVESLDDLLHFSYPALSYTILAVNQDNDYLQDWGLERVRNFYLEDSPGNWMGDFDKWRAILSQFPVNFSNEPRHPEEVW